MQGAGKLMVARNYAPMFPIDLVDKDFGYAQALARTLDATAPTLDVVRTLYADVKAQGYGNDNIVGVKQLFDS